MPVGKRTLVLYVRIYIFEYYEVHLDDIWFIFLQKSKVLNHLMCLCFQCPIINVRSLRNGLFCALPGLSNKIFKMEITYCSIRILWKGYTNVVWRVTHERPHLSAWNIVHRWRLRWGLPVSNHPRHADVSHRATFRSSKTMWNLVRITHATEPF